MAKDTPTNTRPGTYGSLETDGGDDNAGSGAIDDFNDDDEEKRALLEWRRRRGAGGGPDGGPRLRKTTAKTKAQMTSSSAGGGRRRPRGSGMTRQGGRRNVRVPKNEDGDPGQHRAVFATLFDGDDGDSSGRTASTEMTTTTSTSTPGGAATTPEGGGVGRERHHSLVYTILNPRSKRPEARAYQRFISTVVVVDLILFVVSTDPAFENDKHFFEICEGITSTIFLVEYVARLITITESKRYGQYGPIMGRVWYALTWPAIIDAAATFPFWIELITGVEMPTLTYLRVFRLFRICKTQGWSRAMDAVWRVVYFNREILYVAALVCVFLVLITAVLMYYLRPPDGVDVEDDFSSIPATMYMSTLMLTGQGGPDGTNLPWYTKIVVLLTGVFSVAMFAIPASMLTWGFEAEAERLAARARRRAVREQKRASRAAAAGGGDDECSCHSSTSSSGSSSSYSSAYSYSSSSVDTSDEEYFKIISGDGDAEEEGEEGGKPVDATAVGGGGSDAMVGRKSSSSSSVLPRSNYEHMEEDGARYVKLSELRRLLMEAAAVARGDGGGVVAIGRSPGATTTTTPSRSGGGDEPPPPPSSSSVLLSSRIDRLEAKVDAADAKLDRLLRMVEESMQQR